jgi:hypothetical protein
MYSYNPGGAMTRKRLRVTRYTPSGSPPYYVAASLDLDQTAEYGNNNVLTPYGRLTATRCPASTTFPVRRQLFLPIDDNNTVGKPAVTSYTGSDRSRG